MERRKVGDGHCFLLLLWKFMLQNEILLSVRCHCAWVTWHPKAVKNLIENEWMKGK
jgi:hypothetical protein